MGRLGLEDDRVSSYGYRYVLPVRFAYRADDRRGAGAAALLVPVAGPERVARRSWWSASTATAAQTRRLARFPLDPETLFLAEGEDGVSRPLVVDDGGVVRTQGAAIAHGRWYLTALAPARGSPARSTSAGPAPSARYRWATPMGPEDIAWWPSTDLLWSVTEHPRRRWVYAMKRSWFGVE